MNSDRPWYEDIVIPALLRHARNTYGIAMRSALEEAGYTDMPRNGMYVIGGLARGAGDVPLGQLVRELRVSKQAAGQLVDTLVVRGYLERAVDEQDRRKLTIALTPRGRAAAEVQAGVVAKIDAALAAEVGEENIKRTRRTLAALCAMTRDDGGDDDH